MRRMKEHIRNLFMLGLMIFCFGLTLIYSSRFQQKNEVYMLYKENEFINGVRAIQMQTSEREEAVPISFTTWGVQEGIELRNKNLERTTRADAIVICGSPALLLESSGYLDIDDKKGCLISSDTAFELFGSTDIIGKSIEYSEREFIIRGILKDGKDTIIHQADSKTEAVMDAAAVHIPENKTAESIMQVFRERYGMKGNEVAIDTFSRSAKTAAMALPLLMGCCVCFPLLKSAYRQKNYPFLCGICLLGAILYMTLFLWICEFMLEIPADIVPTKWSDFDFWGELFSRKKEELMTLLQMEIREPERVIFEPFLETVRYSLFSCTIYMFYVRRMKINSVAVLYVYSMGSLFSSFLCVLVNRGQAEFLVQKKSLWFLVIIYLTGMYITNTNVNTYMKYSPEKYSPEKLK